MGGQSLETSPGAPGSPRAESSWTGPFLRAIERWVSSGLVTWMRRSPSLYYLSLHNVHLPQTSWLGSFWCRHGVGMGGQEKLLQLFWALGGYL
jgi:hypothetical protein